MIRAHMPPGGPVLGHLLEEGCCGAFQKEREAGGELVHIEAGVDGRLHVGESRWASVKGDLLHGGGGRLADVVPGDWEMVFQDGSSVRQ